MKRFEEMLASRPGSKVCRQQRIAAGLTLRKAAELIGVMPSVLSLMEQGRMPIDEPVQNKMAEVYGVGPGIE